jgi:ligand-binding sensor domain-containing protein/putative methionine-R-sulfoxide reductase with GAF domain
MRICRAIILYVLVSFIALHVNAQNRFNYNFRYIGQADGLLHDEAFFITQDHKGYVWVATTNGLQRYDGAQFVSYREMITSPFGPRNNGAVIEADKRNQILLISKAGAIEKVNLTNAAINKYDYDQYLTANRKNFVQYTDEKKGKWLLENGRTIYHFDSTANKYICAYLGFHRSVSSFVKDNSSGFTWVADYINLYLFDENTKQVYSHSYNPIQHPLLQQSAELLKHCNFRHIFIDSKQNIWVTTWSDQFFKYDAKTQKLSTYSLLDIKRKQDGSNAVADGVIVSSILEDTHDVIWMSTEKTGLLRYDSANNRFDYCTAQNSDVNGIKYNYNIYDLMQDSEQNIWICTDKGINIFNPYRQVLKTIKHEENTAFTMRKNGINCVLQGKDGQIYVGTWGGGVAIYDSNFKFVKNIILDGVIEKRRIWSIQQADDGKIWMGCQHGFIIIYNPLSENIKVIQPLELQGSTIRCMEKDANGNLWFGLNNGKIAGWDKQQNQFLPYASATLKDASMVFNIFIDRSRHCWVSTLNGFKQFDLEKRVFTNHWLPDEKNKNALFGETCQGIEEFNDSTLMIGTVYGGLNFFNKNTKTFSHVTTTDGLPANTICAVKRDAEGYIWLTTDYGLYKFNTATKKSICFSTEQGVINSPFVAKQMYALQNGEWLTFTSTEAISFSNLDKNDLKHNKPKTEITGFTIFNKPVFIDSFINENKPILLSHKDNFFTIEFANLLFNQQQQINYFYRLNGIDKDWVNGGTKRFANYTDIQPGEYLFEVRADNASITGDITAFKIIITPPFWKTGWFISGVAFCIFLLSFLFIRGREKSLKTVAAAKLKVQQLSAEQYKNKLELEQIINYFSSSLNNKTALDDVLWDTAKNLIGKIGFVDCMIYLWNDDKTKMVQRAGFGPKGSIEEIKKQIFDVMPGQGVVGYVMQTKEPVLIPDTTKDSRYRPDEMVRLSEITVPVIYNDELIGIIDSEHPEKNYFTHQHLQIMSTIATLMADKIKSIEAEQSLQQKHIEIHSMNEELSAAKLEALRSQMNPHFIFNCINSIDALIHSNDKYNATVYLNKFAKLLRNILDSSKQNTVPFSKDIETLKLYIELEELRNENKFKTNIKIDSELLDGDYKVPPLIVQPFVENAILHGLKNKDTNDGKLSVQVKKMNERLQYIITDNGIGRREAAKIRQNKESHYGMQMSYERIKLFNKEKIVSVQVNDLYNDNTPAGTEVIVHLNMM